MPHWRKKMARYSKEMQRLSEFQDAHFRLLANRLALAQLQKLGGDRLG